MLLPRKMQPTILLDLFKMEKLGTLWLCILLTNNHLLFWTLMRYFPLYFCSRSDRGWWKRRFHSERRQLCEHPVNSPGWTGCIWLCLCLTRTDAQHSPKVLIFTRLPTSLWDTPQQSSSYSLEKTWLSPTACSEDAELRRSPLRRPIRGPGFKQVLCFSLFIFFYQHLSSLFQTKPSPDLPRQQPFIVLSLPHSHIHTPQYPH